MDAVLDGRVVIENESCCERISWSKTRASCLSNSVYHFLKLNALFKLIHSPLEKCESQQIGLPDRVQYLR